MMMASGRYVVVELHGRIGNQLFQFASGYAIARRRDAELVFSSQRVDPSDLLLPQILGTAYREATPLQLLRVGQFVYEPPARRLFAGALHRSARALRRLQNRTGPAYYAWADVGTFHPEVFELDLPVYIQGHLQSERYFVECADEIMNALRWPPHVPELPIAWRPAVAVSFRRGDYNSLGWSLPLDYYQRAIELVLARDSSCTVVLFGDDADFLHLVRDRFGLLARAEVALALGSDPLSQLHLQTQCEHSVIANSSFAWWGAWLADHMSDSQPRLVIAPAEFGEIGDRIPERWVTVEGGTPAF